MLRCVLILFVSKVRCFSSGVGHTGKVLPGMLYPRETETRQVKLLDGMWKFRADVSPDRSAGFQHMWYNRPLAEVRMSGRLACGGNFAPF